MGIKEVRERKGMTRKQLADGVGVTVHTIGRYETGVRIPDDEKLRQIAQYLGVDVNELSGEKKGEGMLKKKESEPERQMPEVKTEHKKMMCPFRTFTRIWTDAESAVRFSECLYHECAMYKNGECAMK